MVVTLADEITPAIIFEFEPPVSVTVYFPHDRSVPGPSTKKPGSTVAVPCRSTSADDSYTHDIRIRAIKPSIPWDAQFRILIF